MEPKSDMNQMLAPAGTIEEWMTMLKATVEKVAPCVSK